MWRGGGRMVSRKQYARCCWSWWMLLMSVRQTRKVRLSIDNNRQVQPRGTKEGRGDRGETGGSCLVERIERHRQRRKVRLSFQDIFQVQPRGSKPGRRDADGSFLLQGMTRHINKGGPVGRSDCWFGWLFPCAMGLATASYIIRIAAFFQIVCDD
ncbi:hypothetical protein BJX99DRAFT_190572 [Aspergillus californicus]